MSVKYISAVWSNKNIGEQSTLLVMLALADFSNDEGWSWPSIPTLAEKARISERHVQRILKALEEQKILEIEHRGGRHNTNRYRLTLPICPVLFTIATPEETVTLRPETVTSATETVTPVSQKGDKLCPINHQEPSVKSNRKSKPVFETPDWMPKDAWQAFEEMRDEIGYPLTAKASAMTIKRLDKFRNRGQPIEEILENSVMNSYRGVFEIKNHTGNGNGTKAQQNRDASRQSIGEAVNQRLADLAGAGDGLRPKLLRSESINHVRDGGDLVGEVGESGEETREGKVSRRT